MTGFADAATVFERVQLLLRQMLEDGSYAQLDGRAQRDLTDVVDAAAESARAARELIGLVSEGSSYDGQPVAGRQTEQWLPTNRKERFYTGTVLPMIVASDAFAHLGRFLDLCGLHGLVLASRRDGGAPCQLITEYGFAESIMAGRHVRWEVKDRRRDTPDVVLVGDGWLVAVEAKMFDRPTRAELDHQLAVQRVLVEEWAAVLGVPSERAVHIALLPAALATELGQLTAPVVTWEAVVDAYRVVGPPYWVGVLAHALDQWPVLVAKPPGFGVNAEARLTGASIVERASRSELGYAWMGRKGGTDGPLLAEDVATGRWRTQSYEVRADELPGNPNWFSVEVFLALVATASDGTSV